MRRQCALVPGGVYHLMNKSIGGMKLFHSPSDYLRMIRLIRFFSVENIGLKFSHFLESPPVTSSGFEKCFLSLTSGMKRHVQIIAYCVMPTHIHLAVKQIGEDGVSIFMGNALNGYARYFNLKNERKGPLWQGKFHNVEVKSDEQLLHLTRYIHLNPSTAELVRDAEEWKYSSYHEFIGNIPEPEHRLCDFQVLMNVEPALYRKFVREYTATQRERALIRKFSTPGVEEREFIRA